MADWSQLPQELLTLIAKRLETRFDVLRFRSVCSSWRSSFPPKLYPLPRFLPSKTHGRCEYSVTHITRNTFFLVRLPAATRCCWLVKIRDRTDRVKMRLLDPLSGSELKPLPANFPKVLDLTNFQVVELGHEFVGRYNVDIDHCLEPQSLDYSEKVALMWSSSTHSNDFTMLTLFRCFLHRLAFLRSADKKWVLLENVHDNGGVQDITSFNGKFYAIEREGRTIIVDQSLNVTFLEQVGSPASRKFLVQSVDNLLVVEVLFLTDSDSDDSQNLGNYGSILGNFEVVGFRIFRLDEEGQKWDEMGSLGDQILFLGLRQAISVSASEFCWCKGNLIFYSTGLCIPPRHGQSQDGVMFVFDLETGKSTPLKDCPAYCNLFWPPPEWVTSSLPKLEPNACDSMVSSSPESVVSSREVISNSAYSVSSAAPDTEVGEKPSSKGRSTSSKSSFKFCCF